MSTLFIIVFVIVMIFGVVIARGAPYVPSQRRYIRRAFTDLYHLSNNDTLIDVGSGDGIVLRLAAERGARAVGYGLNPILVIISRLLSIGRPKVKTILADFWLTSFPPDTTVVYLFMVAKMRRRMAKKIQAEATRLQRPLHVMTYGFPFLDREPNKTLDAYFLYTFQPLQAQ